MDSLGEAFMLLIWVAIIFGRPLIPAVMAKNRGRDPVAWYLIGFFFWLIAIILVLVLPDLTKQKAHDQQVDRRAQRLQEELDAERRRSEHFRLEAERRLDVHDQVLGVHTRVALPGAATASPVLVDLGDLEEEPDGQSAPPS
jgi:uncharacterized membrane protein